MQAYRPEDVGLFTFYLQQEGEESPLSQHHSAHLLKLKKQLTFTNDQNQYLPYHSQPQQQQAGSHSQLTPLNKPNNGSLVRTHKILTKVKHYSQPHTSQPKIEKVHSLIKHSLGEDELSNSTKLKARLQDLLSYKEIEADHLIEEFPRFEFERKGKPPLKIKQPSAPLRPNDLNLALNDLAHQLKLQASKFLERKRKEKSRHSILSLLSRSNQQPKQCCQSKAKYKKNKKLPRLHESSIQTSQEQLEKMLPIKNKSKKVLSQKWKCPNKDQQQHYLEPIVTDRNHKNYPLNIQYLPRTIPSNHKYRRTEVGRDSLTLKAALKKKTAPVKPHFDLDRQNKE